MIAAAAVAGVVASLALAGCANTQRRPAQSSYACMSAVRQALPVGEKVPVSQRQLAARLGVGQPRVSRALRAMSDAKEIEVMSGANGTIVVRR